MRLAPDGHLESGQKVSNLHSLIGLTASMPQAVGAKVF
jgi:hypothetical protein